MGKCQGCAKEFASPQSLWNHKQRCKGYVHLADHDEVSPTVEKRNVFHQRNSTPVVRNQGACSTFPDIKKPAKNPKLSAMIDAILNDGESSKASIVSDKIYRMKDTIPTKSIAPEKMDYSKMIGPSVDEESRKYPIIPCTAKRKQKTEPKNLTILK